MSDIVKRLRWRAENTSTPTATTPMLCAEAADTITALRAALSTARADALEEAADAVGEIGDHADVGAYINAIRALKEKPNE